MSLVALLLAALGVILALWALWELAMLRRDVLALAEAFREHLRPLETAPPCVNDRPGVPDPGQGGCGGRPARDRGGLHG